MSYKINKTYKISLGVIEVGQPTLRPESRDCPWRDELNGRDIPGQTDRMAAGSESGKTKLKASGKAWTRSDRPRPYEI